MVGMDSLIVFLAKDAIYALLPISIGLIAWDASRTKNIKNIVVLLLGLMLAVILAKISGLYFYHNQPFIEQGFTPLFMHEKDNSFPSNHTLMATYFALAVIRINWRLAIGLTGLAIIIGVCRVIAGVHYPVDIIGSVIIAAISFIVVDSIVYRLLKDRRVSFSKRKDNLVEQ